MNKSPKKAPTVLALKSLAKTRLFHIEQVNLRFANGVEVEYERLKSSGNGAVLIVPMLDATTTLLIREYAAGVDRYELALPKGKIDPGETMFEAANREIQEETGYASNKLSLLQSVTIAPGYQSHVTHIILAQDLYASPAEGDEPESIEVIPWKLSQINDLLEHEECTEARSIAALFMAREKLANP